MQEFILVMSRCLAMAKSPKSGRSYYRFHFKGSYAGMRISQIHLFPDQFGEQAKILTKGEDYLLWVKHKKVVEGILEVELIACKKIF